MGYSNRRQVVSLESCPHRSRAGGIIFNEMQLLAQIVSSALPENYAWPLKNDDPVQDSQSCCKEAYKIKEYKCSVLHVAYVCDV